ncbi:helix-hairpin-helix domain-containing protein [bacterium]|nr:helix-hairpin-helix domain-containing protein [bacterium]
MRDSYKNTLYSLAVLAIGGVTYLFRAPSETSITQLPSSSPTDITPTTTTLKPPLITVHIAGEVSNPGVYKIPIGTRTLDALTHAGGLTKSAHLDKVNLAKKVKDGQRIFVPTLKQKPSTLRNLAKQHKTNALHHPQERISINSATIKTLQRIPGVGPKLAAEIVTYRNLHGPFSSVKTLLNVKYIGPKMLKKIEPFVTE